jgi:peroxiredoxin
MDKRIVRTLTGGGRGFPIMFVIACSLVFSFGLLYGCSDKKVILKTGQAAPAFVLTDTNGKTIKFPEDMKGKVVAVRFWADWCKSCAREMPEIEKVYLKHKDKGLVVLAVNIGQEKAAVEKFVNDIRISYPGLIDPGAVVTKRYGVSGVPMTVIVDRSGNIRQKILGETGEVAFEEIVIEQLKK